MTRYYNIIIAVQLDHDAVDYVNPHDDHIIISTAVNV